MFEYEDEITTRLKAPIICLGCGKTFPKYVMSAKDKGKCKYCTGE